VSTNSLTVSDIFVFGNIFLCYLYCIAYSGVWFGQVG